MEHQVKLDRPLVVDEVDAPGVLVASSARSKHGLVCVNFIEARSYHSVHLGTGYLREMVSNAVDRLTRFLFAVMLATE